jgi:hypothetical protein
VVIPAITVSAVPLEKVVLPAMWEALESKVFLVLKEGKVLKVLKVPKGYRTLDIKVLKASRGRQDRKARTVRPAAKGRRAFLATMADQVSQDPLDQRVLKVLVERLVLLVTEYQE